MVEGVPGNPAGVRELARHWIQQGQAAANASGTLRSAAADIQGGTLRLQGDFAPKVKDAVGDLPGALDKLARGYRGCGNALNTFADRLEQAQVKARTAASDRDTALSSKRGAEWNLDSLAPGWDAHADNPTGLRAYLAGKPEPAFTAVTRREQATRDVSLADSLARQASQLRGDAERDCARDIERALEDSGLKNRSWWQKTGDWLKTTFTTWDGFVKFCENVSMVLGVVALFLSGPLALIVGAIVLVATIVIIADKGMKLARGEISWKQAAFEIGMAALSRFGGRALGPAFRRLSNTRTITALSRAGHRGADRLASRLNLGDTGRNLAHRVACTVTGHPVDVATGKVFTTATDLELPGPLPFEFTRVWYSTSTYRGPLGHGWHHSYDTSLNVTRDDLLYLTPDGRAVALLPLYPGTEWFDRQERVTLARDEAGAYRVTDRSGLTWRYAASGDDGDLVVHRLREVVSRGGHRISFHRDRHGRLTSIVDSSGRTLSFELDDAGRVAALLAPHPDLAAERFAVARYSYDDIGNLTTVTDALGQVFSYLYDRHLLVRETDRNGLAFSFEYDGSDETARCLHTWGDGGIYNHRLLYATGETTVTNSLGHRSRHEHDDGLVIRTTDAGGGVRSTAYDYQQKISETDPLGRVNTYQYDARGNLIESVAAEGAVLTAEFDDRDLPLRAVDTIGGEWAWTYDRAGQLTSKRNSLAAVTRFGYDAGLLTSIVDPIGGRTRLAYDENGLLNEVRTPDGSSFGWRRNLLGWPTGAVDPLGNEQRRRFDLLGQVVMVDDPDGDQQLLEYDGVGNVTRFVSRLNDVSLRYSGLGRIVERVQAGSAVRFEYDTEEQLTGIVNEHGAVYRFGLGASGQVMTERGFDGLLRMFEHDAAGRVVSIRRGSGTMTRYGYDLADRVVSINHSDGSEETFSYRADGALMSARNAVCVVIFERDLLGRVLREYQDDQWVTSEYDPSGHRTHVQSSLGADVSFERNAVGDVTAVSAVQDEAAWSAVMARDASGHEVSRALPGGVEARWHRDRLGRTMRQEVNGSSGTVYERAYEWDVDDRLRSIVDAVAGPVRYEHDALSQLAAATYADGRVDLRMPDAVGNLFRTRDRSDREYGPAGQLLSADDDTGRLIRYSYDPEGNLVGKEASDGETWRYRWGADGRLHEVTRPDGESISFAYDPLSRRVTKEGAGRRSRYVWDGNTILHARVDTATDQEAFTWLTEPGGVVGMAVSTAGRWASVLVDSSLMPLGTVRDDGEFQALPVPSIWGEQESDDDIPWRWPGQYHDAETGLSYNRFRYYDPQMGSYISQDPVRLLGGFRLYSYVRDVTRSIDFFGLVDLVYRALNALDVTNLAGGGDIVARNPGANVSPLEHVLHGSDPDYPGDQYVSMTRDERAAQIWGRTHGYATIDLDVVREHTSVLDMSTSAGRLEHLGDASRAAANSEVHKANSFARGMKEVLGVGSVPRAAVQGCSR